MIPPGRFPVVSSHRLERLGGFLVGWTHLKWSGEIPGKKVLVEDHGNNRLRTGCLLSQSFPNNVVIVRGD